MRKGIMATILAAIWILGSCGGNNEPAEPAEKVVLVTNPAPKFDENNAYEQIETQVKMGYRIPGTAVHKKCADYLFAELKKYCDTVYWQQAKDTTWDNKIIPIYNLIGSINPTAKQRIMLASHWDSRPVADNDPDIGNHKKPVPAANDGASGVGILLSMAKTMSATKPKTGVDFVLFDAEDWGNGEYENSFCLGSQYWAANRHIPNYSANFGILLDMVGAPEATFGREKYSEQAAGFAVAHVWGIANELGYSSMFTNSATKPVIDDHYYVIKGTGIPMLDIIHRTSNGDFGHYWHTINDNMQAIDKKTLAAVGTVMMNCVYNPPFNVVP